MSTSPDPPHPSFPANRLAGESSPYLLLHAHNPVDWYPWGEEAFARARAERKPIFLSVGYTTCHWCHVMERESFANPAVAALLNRSFVSVKLDREERPDLDEIYMTATQILTGQGGWPNSLFLTPELKPFFAGTYFPREDRWGRPGFVALVRGLAEAWQGRRADVEDQAEEVAAAMRRALGERFAGEAGATARPPGGGAADRAAASLAASFDREHGGFGGAPKFPSPANLLLLLEMIDGRPEASEMLATTLDRMARGGLYDQVGGGFHRYATDDRWLVPHFEKMLYDNGLLLEVYAGWFRATGDPEAARVVRETAAFLARELTAPGGELWSALDADSEGREGAFYVWTRAELDAALGAEDAAFAAPLVGFDGEPFFEDEAYVLHLPEPIADAAARRQTTPAALLAELAPVRARLLAARETRPRPLLDDKVLADWNGLAIAGLAVAGEALGEPELTARAGRAAEAVLARLWVAGADGRRVLHHTGREGAGGWQAKVPAMAADYAFLLRGLLALARTPGGARWLAVAAELADEMVARLRAPEGGFYTAAASPDLLFQTRDAFDGALPSANGTAALALLDLAEATGEDRWRKEAEATLAAFGALVERLPQGTKMLALAARRWERGGGSREELGRDREEGEGGGVGAGPAVAGGGAVEEELGGAEDGGRGSVAGAAVLGVAALEAEAAAALEACLAVEPAGADGWRRFRLALAVAPGWHVQAPDAAAPLVPFRVEGSGAEVRRLSYPASFALEPSPGTVGAAWHGEIEVTGELRAEHPRAALRLTWQACDATRCLPPVAREVAV